MITLREALTFKKEYKTLGEIATEIYRGNEVTKEQIGSGTYPCVVYKELYSDFWISFNKCLSTVNPDLIKNKKYGKKGQLLISTSSNYYKNIGVCCSYLGDEKIIIGGDISIVEHNQDPKYLSYALSTRRAYLQKRKLSHRGTVTHLNLSELKKLQLPIPSLDIQKQISYFLDLLRSEVKRVRRELEERQKQYEYYKDLTIGKIEKRVKLEEIATEIFRGNNITKSDVSKTGFPCILYRDVNLNKDLFIDQAKHFVDPNLIKKPRFCCKGDILIINSLQRKNKSYLGKPNVYLGEETIIYGESMFLIKHEQNPYYLAFSLSTKEIRNENKCKAKTTPFNETMNLEETKKIIIPLPDLPTQESIANTIDKFRKLCIEILPRELDLVQKRYEYYKDLLIDGVS